ncbi:cilia- and flagella-associated protein 61-like [Helicoverpa zea]|uniref:cilia- and flagella-associated protein 61-like n=1 Tax=Helicoverpa zea TaxID=7113 RepID=UPI001F58B72D|nr:cilia- and flagella-associated protein 61-like [Helicoverpa zea]
MSIYFDFDVGPKGRQFRRAVEADKDDIELIWNRKHTKELFFDINIGSLIELSALSICMINDKKEVIGFMALSDHPPVSGLDPSDWEYWTRNMFQRYFLSRNTLFIHFMCCIDSVTDFFVEEALISVFMNDYYLNYIVLVVPLFCPEELITRFLTFKKRNIMRYNAKSQDVTGSYLYTALRTDFCPRLRMRRAVEEDNDDIVEILDKKCPRLKKLYGEYYISEIIGRHPESDRKIIVADVQGRAVAVMCINTEINYKKLQKLYELRPFHGLRAATPLEREQKKRGNALLQEFGEPIMTGQWGPFHRLSDIKHDTNKNGKNKSNSKGTRRVSKVSFTGHAPNFDHMIKSHSDDFSDPIKPSKKIRPDEEESTVYQGVENAFMIELFAFRDDIDERYAYDLLEAAFELAKDYDYCIIRVPSADKTFPLLQHFCFVPTKPRVSCKYSLYVAHRSSVLGKLRVRDIEIMDVPQIAQLLVNLDAKQTITTIETTFNNKKDNQAYVFTSGMHIVGLGILEPPDEIDFLRGRYNLDSYQIHKYHIYGQGINAGFATIKFALVYPAFEPHFRFFLREMMRLSGHSTLLWMTAYRNKWVIQKANSMVASMIPLTPRTVEIDSTAVPELRRTCFLAEKIIPFSTWFISKKYTTIPKVDINTHIVVVGASRTCLGFLNGLLFGQTSTYLTFNNVTLISPRGLPYKRHSKPAAESMFLRYYVTTDKYLKCVPYTYYVNVIQGTVMEMDLQNKLVTLTSGSRYYYDLLFLFFGKQYQHPDHMTQLFEREDNYKLSHKFRKHWKNYNISVFSQTPHYTPLDKPRFSDTEIQITNDDTPDNVFIINNVVEANRALNYLQNVIVDRKSFFTDKVIVYGATIHAYLCINALLEFRIRPESIIFVEPFPYENPNKTRVPVFDNVYVDKTVIQILESLKIKVYRSFYFKSWSVTVDNLITHADFLSYSDYLNLECDALFYFGKVGVNMSTFIAIHKSGLAYDAGIVIDHEFRTLDPHVYAAGPCTRYHKRYYADSKSHKYYESSELGEKVRLLMFFNQKKNLYSNSAARRQHFLNVRNLQNTSPKTPILHHFLCLGIRIRKQLDPLFVEANSPFTYRWSQDYMVKPEVAAEKSVTYLNKTGVLHGSDFARPEMALMSLTKPTVMYCVLPGGLKYLEVRSPGKKIPHHYVQSLEYNGYVFETFKSGYFKLHLNKDLIVDGITCLSQGKFSLENFKHIYGRPASELNNLHLRYMTNQLDNFFEFFRASWAFFLYHDHADDLFAMIKQLFPKGQNKGLTVKEALCEVGMRLTDSTSMDQKMVIQANFAKSPHIEAVTDFVIDWLSQHDVLLPMYLQPGQTVLYARVLDAAHPIFKKRRTLPEMLF